MCTTHPHFSFDPDADIWKVDNANEVPSGCWGGGVGGGTLLDDAYL